MTQFKVDFNDFKRRDNTNLMEITLYKDNGEPITPNRDHQWSGKALKFGDGDKRLDQELAVTLDGDKIGVPSKQLENLPSGDYGLELWEVNNDSKTIYPSAGFVEFHIHRNADESLESVTPTIDIDKVIDDLHTKFDDSLATAIRYNYEYSENRLYIDGLEKDKYIERDRLNGVITDYPGWALSDYLPVEKNEIYVWTFDIPATGNLVPNVYCGLFDVNKKYIGSGNQETDTLKNKVLIKTDNSTAYVRISQGLKYFTNKAMLVRKSLYDQGIKEFIPFERYLKNSPVKEIEEKTNTLEEKTNTLEEKTNTLEEKTNSFDKNYQPNYDNVVRSIQRIGASMEHPIHSVEAFKDAYRKGFRILLCDLIFTSDNVPVCNHDLYLNEHYKNVYDSNGALVSTDNPIYFSQNTYATLSKYNYGAMGYPLLKFTDMLKLVRQLGVELYVEVKGMTEQQAKIACDLVRQFGLINKTSWAGTFEQMNWVIANVDTARVALMPGNLTDYVIEKLNSLKTGKNKVFIFGWDTTVLTDEIINKLMQNDIAFEQGTPNTEQDIKNYFARGNQYYYCTGVETNSVIAGKVLLESSLSNTGN